MARRDSPDFLDPAGRGTGAWIGMRVSLYITPRVSEANERTRHASRDISYDIGRRQVASLESARGCQIDMFFVMGSSCFSHTQLAFKK